MGGRRARAEISWIFSERMGSRARRFSDPRPVSADRFEVTRRISPRLLAMNALRSFVEACAALTSLGFATSDEGSVDMDHRAESSRRTSESLLAVPHRLADVGLDL